MATGFYLPDGRDFSSVFTAGNAGLNTGFKIANGADIGNQFVAGNSGIATNYIPIGGGDLGSKLGVTKSYSQVLINSNTTKDQSWTINKYITHFITTYRPVMGAIGVYLDNVLYTHSKGGDNLTVTVNKYVSIVSIKQRYDEGLGVMSYLAIYGTYI